MIIKGDKETIMKAGDRVTIYRDPITQTKPDGEAVLIKYLFSIGFWEGKELQRWQVRYIAKDWTEIFERDILV